MITPSNDKQRASRNKTLTLNDSEIQSLKNRVIELKTPVTFAQIENKTIHQDTFIALDYLPSEFVDLAFIDPPYNLSKSFNETSFKEMDSDDYEKWLESWIIKVKKILKPNASIYICGDWKSSGAINNVVKKYFNIQNRITWEREKGRGAKHNWKNCSEDIWFCTMANDYCFNVEAVKMKRKVIAPYRDETGNAKDWQEERGGKYRITHPSNLWTDISIPFWSMPENTDHPTQKPEKLVAKIILASSRPGDVVFDPFLGSGTTSVVAKKLERKYVGVEIDEYYCCLTEKRLKSAEYDMAIQGYRDGVFWERNTLNKQTNGEKGNRKDVYSKQGGLFINQTL
ncbi:MAG: DNA methylase [Candidatus Blackburnbacteria bacterium RIFCSPLOWO2_01_FULL_41_27]|uniref:Methyltransferase n=2 Tax=Candidatus Blackburniibacteriota TaxID=1817898 RepID=A0A1G1V9F7_9BACT|nr:MAG: DNA methylase [Candidatus Blackburnbacteria bacterium RIFCSPHIGHO2_12_FULL_41_13b]OGY14861.1 MAG: DNA methylase [Candidatus Blackburnbacteria bacterium RIFCSPLOWO2_01_FULL_41_27]